MAENDMRLNFYLSYALLVRPVLDADHFAVFLLSRTKLKLLLLSIDIEADYSSSNINVGSHSAKEWSPKNER
jgi:hypothetical protein